MRVWDRCVRNRKVRKGGAGWIRFWIGVLFLPALAEGAWVDITRKIQGPLLEGTGKLLVAPGRPMEYQTRRKTSVRWVFHITRPGSLWVIHNGDTVARLYLDRGRQVVRRYLQPGRWVWVSRAEGTARVYRWKVRRWKSLVPVGGGYPVVLAHRSGKRYTYYWVRKGEEILFRPRGPNRAHVLVRVPLDGRRQGRVVVDVEMDGRLLKRYTLQLSRSRAVWRKDGRRPVSRAREILLRIPRGRHEVRLRVVEGEALVKFYVEKKRKRRKPTTGARGWFRGLGRWGLMYDANAYRFSPEARDTFLAGTRSYRYPGVQALSDRVVTVELEGRVRRRRGVLGVQWSSQWHLVNRDLSWWKLSLWGGYARWRAGMLWIPRYPIRPTYVAPRTYRLLEEAVFRGWVSWRGRPVGIGVEGGMYRFNDAFSALNARFVGVRLPVQWRHYTLTVRWRRVMDPDTTGGDFSHTRWGAEGRTRWRMTPRIAVRGRLLVEMYRYTPARPGDSREGRTDRVWEVNLTPVYRWTSSLSLVFPVGFRGRWTSSPSPFLDVYKDYTTWWAGMEMQLRWG